VKTTQNNVRIMKKHHNTMTKTPQHKIRIIKNTTTQCRKKEKHHKTM
jgi:hypothetical protein